MKPFSETKPNQAYTTRQEHKSSLGHPHFDLSFPSIYAQPYDVHGYEDKKEAVAEKKEAATEEKNSEEKKESAEELLQSFLYQDPGPPIPFFAPLPYFMAMGL